VQDRARVRARVLPTKHGSCQPVMRFMHSVIESFTVPAIFCATRSISATDLIGESSRTRKLWRTSMYVWEKSTVPSRVASQADVGPSVLDRLDDGRRARDRLELERHVVAASELTRVHRSAREFRPSREPNLIFGTHR
jgi:hypothetical protein